MKMKARFTEKEKEELKSFFRDGRLQKVLTKGFFRMKNQALINMRSLELSDKSVGHAIGVESTINIIEGIEAEIFSNNKED